jgi:hypothetical protein
MFLLIKQLKQKQQQKKDENRKFKNNNKIPTKINKKKIICKLKPEAEQQKNYEHENNEIMIKTKKIIFNIIILMKII